MYTKGNKCRKASWSSSSSKNFHREHSCSRWMMDQPFGTIFFRDSKQGDRLFVKWQNQEFEAKMPCRVSADISAFGNAVFFKSEEVEAKIYKAEFTPFGGIDISYVRDVLEDERMECDGVMSRVVKGKNFVYRLGDDLVCNGVLVEGTHAGIVIRDVHRAPKDSCTPAFRGRSVHLLEVSNGRQLTARKLDDTKILIEGPASSELKLYSSESSRLLYFEYNYKLHVLDVDAMEFLPPVTITGIHSIIAIIGVYEGVMTVAGRKDTADYMMSAELPGGYVSQFEQRYRRNAAISVLTANRGG
ncbi:hypothetical protein PRIPAC_79132 [Pristionchus pacificus]|uniref:Uncharacterized protein n=1 Tax=Pristionchus pacificus TaxID=54126 RepID=A0A2A6CLP6_PRIPA|nr:hypothetical protein PRIPAC_79132 [Pristionchus pacificus]|eukprot:PDM78997.1 hypothetical protein PRIPAC_31576 [Pristionchus pacificus]